MSGSADENQKTRRVVNSTNAVKLKSNNSREKSLALSPPSFDPPVLRVADQHCDTKPHLSLPLSVNRPAFLSRLTPRPPETLLFAPSLDQCPYILTSPPISDSALLPAHEGIPLQGYSYGRASAAVGPRQPFRRFCPVDVTPTMQHH